MSDIAFLPENVVLSRRAVKDLDALSEKEARIVIEDVIRLAGRTFPGEIKMIVSLPQRPLQADSGRFRILHRWAKERLEIITVFPKKIQNIIFKGLR